MHWGWKKKPLHVFHRIFGWLSTNFFYSSDLAVKNTVNRLGRNLGRRLSLQTPRLNACLENGCRIHASIAPVSFYGPNFTIRKFREKPFTPVDLIENKTVSEKAIAFLWMAMETDCSVLFVGNTGSGKTSTMNALFSFVPANERIVSVEETPEIFLPQKHLVKLNVVESLEIGMHDLIFDTLRMRPDRIVIGEIRNSIETKAFIDTLLAGQGKGSYATFHGQSSIEALNRLKNLGANELDLSAIDLIVVQKRWTKIDFEKNSRSEKRKIVEICEILPNGEGFELNKLFEYSFGENCLVEKNFSKKVLEKAKNFHCKTLEQIESELLKRENFLKKSIGKNLEINEFFKIISSGAWRTNAL